MDWLSGIKELGFPAMIAFALLWVLTTKIEGFRKELEDLQGSIRDLKTCIDQLRVEVARGAGAERKES